MLVRCSRHDSTSEALVGEVFEDWCVIFALVKMALDKSNDSSNNVITPGEFSGPRECSIPQTFGANLGRCSPKDQTKPPSGGFFMGLIGPPLIRSQLQIGKLVWTRTAKSGQPKKNPASAEAHSGSVLINDEGLPVHRTGGSQRDYRRGLHSVIGVLGGTGFASHQQGVLVLSQALIGLGRFAHRHHI